MVIGPP